MKICPYCGKRHSDEFNFCSYCNKELYSPGGVTEAYPAAEVVTPPISEEAPTPEPEALLPSKEAPAPILETVPPAPSEERPPSKPKAVTPFKGKWKWLAVVAVVVIIVVAAGAVYFLFLPKGKSAPVAKAKVGKADGWFVANLTKMSPSVSVNGIRYILQDNDGNKIGEGLVAEVYSKEVNYTKFLDSDADGKLSVGDKFFIKAPPAVHGYKLILIYEPTGAIFLEKPL